MNTAMKATAAAALALILTACGGGGGGGNSNQAAAPVTPSPAAPVDPVSGNPTSDARSTTVAGVVYASYVAGATVTAYNVQPDGSNGSVLGTSSVTGTDGKFSMNLTAAPAGMVRLVASGGSFASEADATKQTIDTLELVTPYVTTALNNFVITPVTHIASRGLAHRAKSGATLVDAYSNAWNSALSLSGTNTPLKGDTRGIVNILSTMPNSTADSGKAYQDLVTGLEWYGVKYDLPSKVVFRVAAAAGEAGYSMTGVDGAAKAVNVGKWVSSSFDETQVRTLDQMMEWPKAQPTDPTVYDNIKDVMSLFIIRDFYVDAGCKDASRRAEVLSRYPNLAGMYGSPAETGICEGVAYRISDLKAKAATNNRASMK